MEQRIRVLIADDRPPSRNGLRALLASWPVVQTIYEAVNGLEALAVVEEVQPDVVLMDVRMPVMDGLEATRLLKRKWPAIKVIVLSIGARYRSEALSAGADVFLLKGCPTEDLMAAIAVHTEPRRSSEDRAGLVPFRTLCTGLAS